MFLNNHPKDLASEGKAIKINPDKLNQFSNIVNNAKKIIVAEGEAYKNLGQWNKVDKKFFKMWVWYVGFEYLPATRVKRK